MSMGGLLPDTLLRELYDAAIAAGLERESLVAGLDRRLVVSFRKASSPGAQTWEDLAALNDIPGLADGSVPLRAWLETAKRLSEPRRESAFFQRALDLLDGKPSTALRAAAPPQARSGATRREPDRPSPARRA